MKIIHLSPSFLPKLGGVETHVSEIVKLQKKAGNKVEVLYSDNGLLKFANNDKGLTRIAKFKIGSTKLNIWLQIYSLLDELNSADIIHVHDVTWWLWPFTLFLTPKIVTTFHGWEGKYPVELTAKLSRLLSSMLSDKTVHVGDWIRNYYFDKPNAVIYGGVKAAGVSRLVPISWPRSKNKLNIIFLGRLELENDIDLYLQLFNELKKKVALKITWVGDGKYRQQCEKLGVVTGMVSDYQKYIAKADLVCSSSYLSMLSAQAAGKIVIALHSHPLKKDYLQNYPGNSAMLIGDNPKHVAAQILKLIKDKAKFKSMSEAAYEFASHSTWEDVNKVYMKLYQL